MLSRLALQRGASLWRPKLLQCSNYWAISGGGPSWDHGEDIKTLIARWDKANKIYYGPDRDFKNFPSLRIPEHHPPVRFGFLPGSWFDAFYEKTGVTGPYMLLTSGTIFALSKEYIVVDHNLTEIFAVYGAVYLLIRKFADGTRNYANSYVSKYMNKYWYEPMKDVVDEAHASSEDLKQAIKQEEGQKFLYEAKRENVDLQLEYVYRQRLAEVHQAVKKRLDYQVDKENAVKRFEQNHMVRWIIQNVMKSITPQQEKDTLARCIQDLKALSVAKA